MSMLWERTMVTAGTKVNDGENNMFRLIILDLSIQYGLFLLFIALQPVQGILSFRIASV